MIDVKICGLTRLEDAEWAIECGADRLGFVFEPTSPRSIGENGQLLDALSDLDPAVPRVAVFGPAPAAFDDPRFAAVQALGQRPKSALPFIRAIRIEPSSTVESVLEQAGDADLILLDAHAPNAFGGTGQKVDWHFAAEIVAAAPVPVILAGGLRPENVAEAIRIVQPAGVDVASGVEEAPGIKSRDRVRRFIAAVRGA